MKDPYYLVRFDDICPTMSWKVWDRIEDILDKYKVCPILAVVPDNHDPMLVVDDANPLFWDRVRSWQSKGYTIAIHGYRHEYVNNESGIIRLSNKSEFAGLTYYEQLNKLKCSFEIFSVNEVCPDAWVAPSHSFDRETVRALASLDLRVISDGLWTFPFTDSAGIFWVPQQLWNFYNKQSGVWTVCFHHNVWGEENIQEFERNIIAYSELITNINHVRKLFGGRRLTIGDRLAAFVELLWNHRLVKLRQSLHVLRKPLIFLRRCLR